VAISFSIWHMAAAIWGLGSDFFFAEGFLAGDFLAGFLGILSSFFACFPGEGFSSMIPHYRHGGVQATRERFLLAAVRKTLVLIYIWHGRLDSNKGPLPCQME
jgi:hypothetical protein